SSTGGTSSGGVGVAGRKPAPVRGDNQVPRHHDAIGFVDPCLARRRCSGSQKKGEGLQWISPMPLQAPALTFPVLLAEWGISLWPAPTSPACEVHAPFAQTRSVLSPLLTGRRRVVFRSTVRS